MIRLTQIHHFKATWKMTWMSMMEATISSPHNKMKISMSSMISELFKTIKECKHTKIATLNNKINSSISLIKDKRPINYLQETLMTLAKANSRLTRLSITGLVDLAILLLTWVKEECKLGTQTWTTIIIERVRKRTSYKK